MRRLDFAAMMRAGICGLGLRPAEFWALTPAELRLMLGPAGPEPMRRDRLIELCRRYPDEERS
ncbi:MAG: putative phage protein (TIGR02216 family) [Limimaricola cinnabarinus]|jgi:uncharacterized phage protein (TIGR02216 family)|uniref:Gene Transfer Agent n=1 Tax=Limimaricola cinnabarinus LL-001 TaxID=1337093 RepID=U3AQZ8_9RHOB|nr:rcc01693 family protein [Limimaricola cinnabarinus]GAD57163.1 Gene Transfer Agent [Limimaricola cinnabarinus LL-001]